MISLLPSQKVRWPGGTGLARVSGAWAGETVEWQYSATESATEPPDSDFQAMGPLSSVDWTTPEDKLTIKFFLPDGVWIRPYLVTGGDNLEFFVDRVLTKVSGDVIQAFPYSTRADLDNIFGRTNIDKWADLENNGDPLDIDARVDWAIASADAHINGKMLEAQYELPLPTDDRIVVDLSARQAGLNLYDSRLITDTPSETDELSTQRKIVEGTIGALLAGTLRLTTVETKVAIVPQNIIDERSQSQAGYNLQGWSSYLKKD